jgi:hypothetical protein
MQRLYGLATTLADAELADAAKALDAAKTDEARAGAKDLRQKAAARAAGLGRNSTPPGTTPPPEISIGLYEMPCSGKRTSAWRWASRWLARAHARYDIAASTPIS